MRPVYYSNNSGEFLTMPSAPSSQHEFSNQDAFKPVRNQRQNQVQMPLGEIHQVRLNPRLGSYVEHRQRQRHGDRSKCKLTQTFQPRYEFAHPHAPPAPQPSYHYGNQYSDVSNENAPYRHYEWGRQIHVQGQDHEPRFGNENDSQHEFSHRPYLVPSEVYGGGRCFQNTMSSNTSSVEFNYRNEYNCNEPDASSHHATSKKHHVNEPVFKKKIQAEKSVSYQRQQPDGNLDPRDIVCGRGAPTNYHIGNHSFKELVEEYQTSYLCAKRCDKPNIAMKVLDIVKARGARFVRRQKGTGRWTWVEIEYKAAYEKVCQALRDGAPDLRRQMLSSEAKKKSREIGGATFRVGENSLPTSSDPV